MTRKGYIVLYDGTPESAPVTILRETATQYVIRHDADWADRKAGEERRMRKRYVREIEPST